ncbi:MAG TPA: hypothetical protein VNJ12_00050 [Candidatus Dormibacteraeota bacterium]|nr:hypothetical protein [Candidatus Dormibacteraeota bacterium]
MPGRRQDNGGRQGKFGLGARTVVPPRGYSPAHAEGARFPVYTPMTSSSYRARVAAIRSLQNQYAVSLYSWPGFWGGTGWNPFFFGSGFFIDPFDYAFSPAFSGFSGAGCFGFTSFNNWAFDPFGAQFALQPFANPFYGPSLFCGDPWAPAFFAPSCPLCNTTWFDSFAPGGNNTGFPDASSILPQSSASPSNGAAFSSAAAPPDASSSFTLRSSAFTMNQPAPDEPVTLVFANGSTMRATQYWLGNEGKLHFVASSGDKMVVPLEQLDVPATMAANNAKGIQLLTPFPDGSGPPPRQH